MQWETRKRSQNLNFPQNTGNLRFPNERGIWEFSGISLMLCHNSWKFLPSVTSLVVKF